MAPRIRMRHIFRGAAASRGSLFLVVLLLIANQAARADLVYLAGKVTMEDGSPPPKPLLIRKTCGKNKVSIEAKTNGKGEYVIRYTEYEPFSSWGSRQKANWNGVACLLDTQLSGYQSTAINLNDPQVSEQLKMPVMILSKSSSGNRSGATAVDANSRAPRGVEKAWDRALKAIDAENWALAETQLRAVVERSPRFVPAWNALGAACQNQKKVSEARDAYARAWQTDPKSLPSLVLLLRLETEAKQWDDAARYAADLIRLEPRRYPEAYLYQAIARYQLNDLDNAAQSAATAVALDEKHQNPRTEYIYALILEARRDFAQASAHYRKFLELDPKSTEASAVRARLDALASGGARPALPELGANVVDLPKPGTLWIPGGRKALAAIAHFTAAPGATSFVADYCRALTHYGSPFLGAGIPGYQATLRAYFTAIAEMTQLGETRGAAATVTVSLDSAAERKNAERILTLLGWRMNQADGALRIDLGETPADAQRHPIAEALGIDMIAMRAALGANRPFTFTLVSEDAPVLGGDAWAGLIPDRQVLAGGVTEAFARDLRLARTYAGLSAADELAASAIVSGVGLRAAVERHSEAIAEHGEALAISGSSAVAVPGGAAAEPIWEKLAAASPRDPPAFFRALLQRDGGRLAAFYHALAGAGPARAGFYLESPARARTFYASFPVSTAERKTAYSLFRDLPMDAASGRPRIADAETALLSPQAAALVAIAKIEQKRQAGFDSATATLLRTHYAGWKALFPLFERLPALAGPDFEALARFEQHLRALDPAKRNAALGTWYALVELAASAAEAGTIDAATAARAFRRASEPARALTVLREFAGGARDLDSAVPNQLLRLDAGRLAGYSRVLAAQRVQRLEAARTDAAVLAALGGIVYAARLDPDALLIAEDPLLLSRHDYLGGDGENFVFHAAALLRSTADGESATHLAGGFIGLDTVARAMTKTVEVAESTAAAPAAAVRRETTLPVASAASAPPVTGELFRASARLVQVPATVVDDRGRYISDLAQNDFTVVEEGKPQPLAAFESQNASVSCVLLLDTTVSMVPALPALKNAALQLIDKLRPADSVAVYSFSDSVTALETDTNDLNAARRAVLRAQPSGETALYDALVRTIRDASARTGKKVIVVFTDGDDNKSGLGVEAAIRRAKAAGIPIYTIAEGAAINNNKLLRDLSTISKATGGLPFHIREAKDIGEVFDRVADDVSHGYLLAFQPGAAAEAGAYRRIEVVVKSSKNCKVRAREGYIAE
jgi:Ca-activated chloride channel homolog